jgi:hypothetical protein
VLIATHDQRIMERLPATRIFQLTEGRIITAQSHKDLILPDVKSPYAKALGT